MTDLGTTVPTEHAAPTGPPAPTELHDTPQRTFVPGLELARRFYAEAVRPAIDEAMPGLPHAAALIGPGSEVLGLDTPRSTDHDWGPRLRLFLAPTDIHRCDRLVELLDRDLPPTFGGRPTRFIRTDEGTFISAPLDGSGRHRVEVAELGAWLTARLGFDPRPGLAPLDWLATPSQLLAEVTGGDVFHDDLGELTAVRAALAWYPHDVWLYLMACQWARIAEEEPFVGRTGELGDHLGGAVLAARLVRDLMRLLLLQHRVHAPYAKWLGTAVGRLPDGEQISAVLRRALDASDWRVREDELCRAYALAAAHHDALGVTEPLDSSPRGFHDRPYRVLDAGRFTDALLARVSDPAVLALPRVGGVDQFVDSTVVLSHPSRARACGLSLLTA